MAPSSTEAGEAVDRAVEGVRSDFGCGHVDLGLSFRLLSGDVK